MNKKAQLSLTNPRDAKACQKLLQFDVKTYLWKHIIIVSDRIFTSFIMVIHSLKSGV